MFKVLLVDNEKAIRTGLSAGIDWAALGCRVIGAAESGVDALRQIEAEPPDIVLSDINMDDMNGLDLCRVLQKRYPAIKCILITGFYEFDNAYNAIKCPNVVNLVLKPTSVFKVSEAVEQAIRRIEEDNSHAALQSEMEKQLRQNRELRQSMILGNLLDGIDDAGETEALLAGEEIRLSAFFVLTIHMSGFSCGGDTSTQAEKTVCKYVHRVFAEDGGVYIVPRHQQNLHVVVSVPSGAPDLLAGIRIHCTELCSMIDSCTNFYVSIGISGLHRNARALSAAADEADNAAKFALYGAEYPVVSYASIPPMSDANAAEMKTRLDELLACIGRLDLSASRAALETLNRFCRQIRLPFDEVRNISLLVANACTQQFYSYGDKTEAALSEQYDYYQRLCSCHTPDELFDETLRILEFTITGLMNQHTNRGDVVASVESYIQNNYANELSLDAIASVFCISAGYLGRLFKSRRGVNITAYIQNVRIGKAKELIRNTQLHTYEIAQAVGINDPVYFSKLFKKLTGRRVRDYRFDGGTNEGGAS